MFWAILLIPALMWNMAELNGEFNVKASIPNAAAIMDAALLELETRGKEMTVSLLDPAGNYIDRRKSDGAWSITYAFAYYKFNYLKKNDWDTESVCGANNWPCIAATFLWVAFTKSFACPGAVVLYYSGEVVGVLALSGSTPWQDNDVASHAAEAAGYKKMAQRAKFEFVNANASLVAESLLNF